MVENSGIAFGIPIAGWWWQVVVLVALVGLWSKNRQTSGGLVLIILGGLMNLYERMVWGRVADVLEIPIIHLWINWADILITLGCLIYIISVIRHIKVGPSLRKGADL